MEKIIYNTSTKELFDYNRSLDHAISQSAHASIYIIGRLDYRIYINNEQTTVNFDYLGKCLADNIKRCKGNFTDTDGVQCDFYFERVYTNEYEFKLCWQDGRVKIWKYTTDRAKCMHENGVITMIEHNLARTLEQEKNSKKISLQFKLQKAQDKLAEIQQEISTL